VVLTSSVLAVPSVTQNKTSQKEKETEHCFELATNASLGSCNNCPKCNFYLIKSRRLLTFWEFEVAFFLYQLNSHSYTFHIS
jgi:hypothetical protein